MSVTKMTDLDLQNKRVLIREDFNVPLDENGQITSDTRLRAALPTIQYALKENAKVMLLSHLGRPPAEAFTAEFSLAPVAERLSELLAKPVKLVRDWQQHLDISAGDVVLFENVRFNPGEKSNDEQLAKQLASLCDIFVMDAFATAHRAQASTHGVACFAPMACAGPLLVKELSALQQALTNPQPPVTAIVGGSKVSTKLQVLEALSQKVDYLIVGGGIANTFIAASGNAVGQSLYEPDLIHTARELMAAANAQGRAIPVPTDVVVAKHLAKDAVAEIKPVTQIADDDLILDIGPDTIAMYQSIIAQSNTLLWNGPVGVFEFAQFADGTQAMAHAIAEAPGFSIAGGGDTLAAIDKFKVADRISYISTGGGAFLEFLEGKTLPAIEVLEQRANESRCG